MGSTLVGTFLLACSFLIQGGEGKTYLVETVPKNSKSVAFHDAPEITTPYNYPSGRLDPNYPSGLIPNGLDPTDVMTDAWDSIDALGFATESTSGATPPFVFENLDNGAAQLATARLDSPPLELIDNFDDDVTPWRDLRAPCSFSLLADTVVSEWCFSSSSRADSCSLLVHSRSTGCPCDASTRNTCSPPAPSLTSALACQSESTTTTLTELSSTPMKARTKARSFRLRSRCTKPLPSERKTKKLSMPLSSAPPRRCLTWSTT